MIQKKYLNNIKNRTQLTMLNQKTVIYIILSAILLYLYYKRGGIALFVAFVVVVAGTLFAGAGANAREGLSLDGGGGKGDKECAKMGFKAPKIDKKDITSSLEKVVENIKPVANKYWKRTAEGRKPDNKEDEDENFEKSYKALEDGAKPFFKRIEKNKDLMDKYSGLVKIYISALNPYIQLLDEKLETDKKDKIVNEYIISKLDEIIHNTKPALEFIDLFKKSDEFKELDKDAKKIANYMACLFKHWVSIFKAIQKAKGSGTGDGAGDTGEDDAGEDDAGDDEKPKKKKKKSTKKKSKKKDEDDEDEE